MSHTVPYLIPPVKSGHVCIGIEVEFESPGQFGRHRMERFMWHMKTHPESPTPTMLHGSVFSSFSSQGSSAV